MIEQFAQVTDLPVEGREFSFTDQRIWLEPIAEFGLSYRVCRPLAAKLLAQPHQEGCLISGTLQGSLFMPCARCAEELEQSIDGEFQEFEPFPGTNPSDEEAWWIVRREGLLFLDAAGFLWEQLLLALPVKVLCSPQCRGICVVCGANRNHVSCRCANQTSDPRLSVLRTLNVS
ncbi:MAG TPA: DUF177 domain-containing protein [Desulfonatronum sp.]|nr:DUF177 domain-containing protein [Desulfonatronum sp.]